MADAAAPVRTYSLTYVAAAAIVGLILGALLAWAYFATGEGERLASNTPEIPNLELGGAQPAATSSTGGTQPSAPVATDALHVEDQPAGMAVAIRHAAVTEGQWVVVHESRNGALGNVLGAARFVGGATKGAVELLRGTVSGATYYAVIYADNGDRMFDLESDTPLSDASGAPKAVSFKAQ